MAAMNNTETPDTTQESPPVVFDCSVCLDEGVSEPNPKQYNNDFICKGCVKDMVVPLFEKALHFEFEYPVVWDSKTTIQAEDFADLLGEDFLLRWKQIEREYRTPPHERVICRHRIIEQYRPLRGEIPEAPEISLQAYFLHQKQFLPAPNWRCLDTKQESHAREAGRLVAECGALLCSSDSEASRHGIIDRCYSCNGWICARCGDALQPNAVVLHKCRVAQEQLEDTVKSIFGPDMKRGKDYQLCPNNSCGQVIELKDGCNHMTCNRFNCRWGFCFLCGEGPFRHDSDHWARGQPCPRFGRPDSDRAVYDAPLEPGEVREDEEVILEVPENLRGWILGLLGQG